MNDLVFWSPTASVTKDRTPQTDATVREDVIVRRGLRTAAAKPVDRPLAAGRPPLLEMFLVEKTYDGGQQVLRDICLEIQRGELVGILGPSGAGKSTLLNLAAAIDRPTAGLIFRQGRLMPEDEAELRRYACRQVHYVLQGRNLLGHLTALENIVWYLQTCGNPRRAARSEALSALALLGVESLRNKWPSQMSGGEQQRVALARAIASPAPLLLLDEPTSALDPRSTERLMDVLEQDVSLGWRAVLLITHSPRVARRCRRLLRCCRGTLVPALCKESV